MRAVRSARLLAWGEPIPGYSDVYATEEELARLGCTVVNVSGADIERWSEQVAEDEIEGIRAEALRLGASHVDDETLGRAARAVALLRRGLSEFACTGGTVNCHGPMVRQHVQVGVTACLANSLSAATGVMLSCTGDLPAAVALTLGKAIGRAALYCELYAVDDQEDWILVANGGEGDPAWADGSVRLLPEDHYQGVHGAGVAVAFDLPTGPATLISLTPLPAATGGWRLIIAEADVVGSRHREMEAPNAMVRLRDLRAGDGFVRWCSAGASHHAVLIPGLRSDELKAVAQMLGVQAVCIQEGSQMNGSRQ